MGMKPPIIYQISPQTVCQMYTNTEKSLKDESIKTIKI